MPNRLPVNKTYKLYMAGKFPRTESGRSLVVEGLDGAVLAHICHASRKDLRDAVEAARKGLAAWSGATAYNRGQVLYRMAEMLEGKREDFASLIAQTVAGGVRPARREVDASIDRLVAFAGWADKFAQVFGCRNPVAGPYHNFSFPEPTGVVTLFCPDEPSLLGFVSLVAPALVAGNGVVAVASEKHPLPAAMFAEVCATSDLPAGALNILTGRRKELLEPAAQHREINAIAAAGLRGDAAKTIELGAAENVKRITMLKRRADDWYDDDHCASPWTIEPFVETKTMWHPSAV